MKTVLTCPLSKEKGSHTVPDELAVDLALADDQPHPPGWGGVTFTVCVPTEAITGPLIAELETARQGIEADGDVPPEQKEAMQAQLADTRRAFEALPNRVILRYDLPAVGPQVVLAVREALERFGVKLPEPTAEQVQGLVTGEDTE